MTCWGALGLPRKKKTSPKNFLGPALYLAMSLRLHPSYKIGSDLATLAGLTKILLTPSKMDGFQIFKILLVAKIKDYHNLPKKITLYPNYSGLSFIYSDFS